MFGYYESKVGFIHFLIKILNKSQNNSWQFSDVIDDWVGSSNCNRLSGITEMKSYGAGILLSNQIIYVNWQDFS